MKFVRSIVFIRKYPYIIKKQELFFLYKRHHLLFRNLLNASTLYISGYISSSYQSIAKYRPIGAASVRFRFISQLIPLAHSSSDFPARALTAREVSSIEASIPFFPPQLPSLFCCSRRNSSAFLTISSILVKYFFPGPSKPSVSFR